MTANPHAIRAEHYTEIGAVLRRDATLIIDRWSRRAAQEQPSAVRVHYQVLLDHLPEFLNALGRHLAEEDDAHGPYRRRARQHGDQRWEAGWSLAEVVRDYGLLRLVVLDYLEECLDRPLTLREAQAVGLAFDDAIESAVEQYVRGVEASLNERAAALVEADRRKNEFLATLAHELRNPLAPLRNSLEVVRLAGDTPDAFAQAREVMDRQVGQLTRLVEDLLDVTRIAQGKLELRRASIDLRAVLEQSVPMSKPLIEARRHRLHVALPTEALWVEGDRDRLVQVTVNLLNNAAKYTPDGGDIWLSAAREAGQHALRVRDNGVGIPPEKLAHVFDLFAQLDLGSNRSEGGLGIGLTLVRRLVEMHSGSIAAASPGAGQGSEFTVRLPATTAPTEAPVALTPKWSGKTRSVLIVEDNRDGRETLARLLKLLGHQVHAAEDGARGIETALALRPEVALIDLGLPDQDGCEVAKQLRVHLERDVFLIALTGFSQPEDRERAAQAGFDAFLTKPVELAPLQALLVGPPTS